MTLGTSQTPKQGSASADHAEVPERKGLHRATAGSAALKRAALPAVGVLLALAALLTVDVRFPDDLRSDLDIAMRFQDARIAGRAYGRTRSIRDCVVVAAEALADCGGAARQTAGCVDASVAFAYACLETTPDTEGTCRRIETSAERLAVTEWLEPKCDMLPGLLAKSCWDLRLAVQARCSR